LPKLLQGKTLDRGDIDAVQTTPASKDIPLQDLMAPTSQDLMDPLLLSPSQESMDSSKLSVSSVVYTKFQVPDFHAVAQAISIPQVAIPLLANTATNARDEDAQISTQLHQVALHAASNGPNRLQAQAPPTSFRVCSTEAFPRRSLDYLLEASTWCT